ncbi:MAG: chromate transporter [Alkaliphilus sp.]|nr:chromate transporter [Alkaliphilus sp.]
MIYLTLYWEFFKIGLFAVGGSLATLPFIRQLVGKYGWITERQILDMIAISESTPGSIGVNVATFVGNVTAGVLGGIVATMGVITSSIVIIIIVAHYITRFHETQIIKSTFVSIRPAATGLIAAVGFEIARISLFSIGDYAPIYELFSQKILSILNMKAILLFGAIIFLLRKYKKHPLIYLAGAAAIGIIFKF